MPGMGRFPPDGTGLGVLPGSAAEIRVADPLIGGKRALFMPEELIVKPPRPVPPRRRGADAAIAGLFPQRQGETTTTEA